MAYVRNRTVRVVITDNPLGGFSFALNSNNGFGPVQNVDFDNDNHPGVIVYFNIDNRTNSVLRFQPVPSQALWVQPPGGPWVVPPGSNCPALPSSWPGFVPLSVEADQFGNPGQQLIVYDRNENAGVQFQFALRFIDAAGNPVNYDPIGNDNNGLRS